MSSLTPILIAATVAGYFLQLAAPGLIEHLALWPLGSSQLDGFEASFGPWQLVTYAFLHGGPLHLGLNMLALYMFGGPVEQVFGSRRYLAYYFASVVSAGVTQLAFSAISGSVYPTVGASGGVFGLLLAFAVYFPHQRIMLLIPPIPLPARVFVTLYALLELYLGVTGTAEGIAHFAHLGGMVGGYLMLRHYRRPARRSGWR